jgi:hypothetical protein
MRPRRVLAAAAIAPDRGPAMATCSALAYII